MFIQSLACILAGQMKLRVVYDASMSTFAIGQEDDGSLTLYLASTILDSAGPNVDTVLRGALAHEAVGHGYHTNFKAQAKGGEYARCFANVLEDIRIERLAPARFPGARRLLAEMVTLLQREFGFWKLPPADDWQGSLVMGLLCKYRTQILGQTLDTATTDAMLRQAIDGIGQELFDTIDGMARAACFSNSTQEVAAIADAIVALLALPLDQSKKKPSEGAPNDKKEPSDGGQHKAFDASRTVAADVEAGLKKVESAHTQPVSCNRATQMLDLSQAPLVPFVSDVKGQVEADPALVRMLSTRLESAVRSIAEDADDEDCDVGRLNCSMLPSIVAGSLLRPFIQDSAPAPGTNTELMLMVDASSSMTELGVEFISSAVRATLTALSRLAPDLSTSVSWFADAATLHNAPGQRLTPKRVATIASWYLPSGGTDWEGSALSLLPHLVKSRRPRRLLVTVTDGRIARAKSPVLAELHALGIECRFLSIGKKLPNGYDGIVCEANRESFAKAFCDTILAGIRPEFA